MQCSATKGNQSEETSICISAERQVNDSSDLVYSVTRILESRSFQTLLYPP